ncbi:HNH endonuclease [Streptomyces sp. 3212.3]|uniref:HNH endonuclease n=1 Tax=Streptomyces sp. 3212.3 TaxID=1938846 RepID=UPI000E3B1C0B|nr:HNH endonuclease signature motif containing protein [Streptomyces sp. 3212.3]REE61304.1 HNH endonuclease [Streptomyces sp. 3212.3]
MWKIERPKHTARSSYSTCIKRIKSEELKERFENAIEEVAAAADSFALSAEDKKLYALSEEDFVLTSITTAEMIALYNYRMAQKKSVGRFIYDDLMLSAPQGRCPMCGQRTVSTIDHHLPKTLYPALAVTPLNLIPACSDCNKLKGNVAPTTEGDEPIHPYFDDVEKDPWLCAGVVRANPPALVFRVSPPTSWAEVTKLRAHKHFSLFQLAPLYASQAAQELSNIRYSLECIFERSGADGVREHLAQEADSRRRAHVNSWQTAMYTALAEDEWFCEGGFAA